MVRITTTIALIVLFTSFLFAQTDMTPKTFGTFGGSSEISEGTTVTFSAGQTFYHSYENENLSVNEGFIQIFDVSTDIEEIMPSDIQISVSPNPTTGLVNIHINQDKSKLLKYSVFDIKGIIVKSGEFEENDFQLDLSGYSGNLYFLNILEEGQIIRTFKIVYTK